MHFCTFWDGIALLQYINSCGNYRSLRENSEGWGSIYCLTGGFYLKCLDLEFIN